MVKEFEDFLKNISVTEYKNLRDNPYAFDEDMSVMEFLHSFGFSIAAL